MVRVWWMRKEKDRKWSQLVLNNCQEGITQTCGGLRIVELLSVICFAGYQSISEESVELCPFPSRSNRASANAATRLALGRQFGLHRRNIDPALVARPPAGFEEESLASSLEGASDRSRWTWRVWHVNKVLDSKRSKIGEMHSIRKRITSFENIE